MVKKNTEGDNWAFLSLFGLSLLFMFSGVEYFIDSFEIKLLKPLTLIPALVFFGIGLGLYFHITKKK
jgi:hypothetical protein